MAGVALDELGAARDGLLAAGLLAAGGTRLAHHLIASAIGDDLPRGRRERLHRETARALMAAGADADAVASHLLRCGPGADPEVSALLRRAAADAARHGAPHTAAAYLERALEPSALPATTAAACWPSWRRSPSTPACPTRASACARPWPRRTTATAGSTS